MSQPENASSEFKRLCDAEEARFYYTITPVLYNGDLSYTVHEHMTVDVGLNTAPHTTANKPGLRSEIEAQKMVEHLRFVRRRFIETTNKYGGMVL